MSFSLTGRICPAINSSVLDQASFFDGPFDAHKIGWVVAGVTALVATLVSLFSVFKHARNYTAPAEQRQIIVSEQPDPIQARARTDMGGVGHTPAHLAHACRVLYLFLLFLSLLSDVNVLLPCFDSVRSHVGAAA